MTATNRTTIGMFNAAVQRFGAADAIGQKQNGAWRWSTYRQLAEQVSRLRAGLAAAGVTAGDRVALVSDNRLEWVVVCHAVAGLGAVLVPIGQSQNADETRFIIEASGAKIVICATNGLFDRLAALTSELSSLTLRVGLELPVSHPSAYLRLLDIGHDTPQPVASVQPSDAACILYTSGTTSRPKGVVLSHQSICASVDAVVRSMPLSNGDKSLSVLPWSMSYGHVCELHTLLSLGACIASCSSVDKMLAELGEVQPTMLVAVPQLLQMLTDHLRRTVARKPPMLRTLFDLGRELSHKRLEHPLTLAERLKLEAAERAVLSPLRAQLGGRLEHVFCGSATLSVEVLQFLTDVGLPVYEGYGSTEAGSVVTINRPGAMRLGSVGKPLPGVSVEIDTTQGAEDGEGEIIVRGPSLMTGYHRNEPDAEASTSLADGALRTGDLGFIDGDGFLHVTGRLHEEYKLANGKNVVPSRLERQLKRSAYVRAAVVWGEGREHNVALLVVDVDMLSRWATDRDLHFANTAAMLASPRVRSHLMAEVGEQSAGFRGYERPRAILPVAENLTIEGGMLSTSHKLRRNALLQKYGDQLAELYN